MIAEPLSFSLTFFNISSSYKSLLLSVIIKSGRNLENKALIYQKLEAFTRKYYTNELLKGILFFVGLGLLYLLFTLFVEYFLWLKPMGRTILFWTFITVEVALVIRYILFPVFQLFKIKKGMDYNQASVIIGNHFGEVSDKLTNFLQLSNDTNASELLIASIEQKALNLQPIPFQNAVNFKGNRKYIPLAMLPILFFAFFYLSGNSQIISQSLNRVVNYKEQFIPPAPFAFLVLNKRLTTQEGTDFTIQVKSVGNVIPENAMIVIDDENYYMENGKAGTFQYTFSKPQKNVAFHIEANRVSSNDFELKVVEVPTISNFEMNIQFPSYLNRKSETIQGTGNAVVPEGSKISWNMTTQSTDKVEWTDFKVKSIYLADNNIYNWNKIISQNTDYQIITSNRSVQNFEKLNYQISVIKDQFPVISIGNVPDSLKVDENVVVGQVSDDYGLSKLQIVYYPANAKTQAMKKGLPVKATVFDQFVFSFPGNLPVEEGVSYDYYFEVFDNDALHNYKSTKSTVFSDRIQTLQEKQDELMQQQNSNINGLQKSLKLQDKQLSELDKLQKSNKEKGSLEFKDQQKVDDFIKRQKQQDEMMKQFTKKMDENLDKIKTEKNNEFKEALQKRLEESQKDLEKNQKLLDELQKLNDKIQQEELFEKMERFKQISKNQAKTLEQLVELTKRFYVEKKAEQIADKLEQLSEEQEKLSEENEKNNVENQDKINKEFDGIQEDLKELDKENKELKAPMEIPMDKEQEKSIDEDLNKAKDELQKDKKKDAKPKQKSAAKKMKEMSGAMEESMAGGEKEQMEEDVAMLRQVMDNLLSFSFTQEDLMNRFKNLKRGAPSYNKYLKTQQDLRLQFQHVDDSLFALSLRNPMLSEPITKEIGNVQYNIEKALDNLVETNVSRGASHQQYTISSANKLADMLSSVLNNMQMSLSGSGEGKPKPSSGKGEMQLPDIMMKQKGLGEKMKDGMKKGKESGKIEGDGKEGDKGQKPGQKPGQSGGNGKEGEGESGSDGEGSAKQIMEIYKEQRQLREALQKELNKNRMSGEGQNAFDQMKDIEKQLLNEGFKNQVLEKVRNLNYELLKLDKAMQQQGEEEKRQAESSKSQFDSNNRVITPALKEYLNSIEILNRQSLPLRSNFSQKVKEYFNTND
jgi:hypothetical protein